MLGRRSSNWVWVLLVAFAVLAAACSSDDDGDVSAEATPDATEEATEAPVVAAFARSGLRAVGH